MKYVYWVFLFFIANLLWGHMSRNSLADSSELFPFASASDIGPVTHPGSTMFDAKGQLFRVSGSGANMWGQQDECHFAWKQLKGDFLLRSETVLVGAGVEAHRKAGIMIRTSLDSSSAYVDVSLHGDGLASLQFRRISGGETEQIVAPIADPSILQLERKGNTYVMRVAWRGEPFASDRSVTLELGDEVYAGIFVCSHNAEVIETAEFHNLRLVVPAPTDFTPYRDYIGCNLEILDVETGRCEIVYRTPEAIHAPNWTIDGKALIYNSGGRLYRFDLDTRQPKLIDTDFATANNNDHVLSFDGKHLGISHHSTEDRGMSMIYVVPTTGGVPQKITSKGPSYFHGWSPDGKDLVYAGDRDGQIDIYKVSVDGGEEIGLTKSPGLDDGPEYAPDGKRIYFCSSRTGRMQIWRMQPGGYDPEQVTDDAFNNWFPHVAPNGKSLVFLTFESDVKSDDHPFYKQVYLRQIPIGGGPPRVIAYVYGGQGTINVPSWSPDSKRLAFVSHTAGN